MFLLKGIFAAVAVAAAQQEVEQAVEEQARQLKEAPKGRGKGGDASFYRPEASNPAAYLAHPQNFLSEDSSRALKAAKRPSALSMRPGALAMHPNETEMDSWAHPKNFLGQNSSRALRADEPSIAEQLKKIAAAIKRIHEEPIANAKTLIRLQRLEKRREQLKRAAQIEA